MNAVVSLILWKMCTENYVLQTYLPSTVNKEQQLKHKKKKQTIPPFSLVHFFQIYNIG